MNSKEMIFCTSILLAASFVSCDDIRMNTASSDSPVTAPDKLAQHRQVLPVKEIIGNGDPTIDDHVLMLTGQIVSVLTPISDHNKPCLDLDLQVELELKPLTGEELGWKIGGISIDRMQLDDQSRCTIEKDYLIDQTHMKWTLNLLFDINQMQLTVQRIWISWSKDNQHERNTIHVSTLEGARP